MICSLWPIIAVSFRRISPLRVIRSDFLQRHVEVRDVLGRLAGVLDDKGHAEIEL